MPMAPKYPECVDPDGLMIKLGPFLFDTEKESNILFPVEIFENRKLTILESINV